MEMADLPDSVRARLAQQGERPPLEVVREFLLGYVADAESLHEVETRLRRIAGTSTRMHRRVLGALESVLATELREGTAAQLVGWDGNWVLDDPSDAGAAEFLRGLAGMLRSVIDQAGRDAAAGD
ncbi:hypothetical protein Ade02nite_73350 [Paractinoplanes deccanensis]|uniref:CdiI immunity protein domain-containing protein n=1 Tax=Paractinoplanes deccanensis TaxID=113561 RepID=A0ABQ3YFF1_9ACTN|nr:hypothetical protein [Actinoplanes deccanensis]GID78694.1 hypothetical protein Ade02nite_73350 [Actinoplanes deccanensis]